METKYWYYLWAAGGSALLYYTLKERCGFETTDAVLIMVAVLSASAGVTGFSIEKHKINHQNIN